MLFVCTGNIFRSLTAEHALRQALCGEHVVRPNVRDSLLSRGFDVGQHQRRTLTREILQASHLVIAMSVDHRAHIRDRFQGDALLFLEACGELGEALPDIEEAVLDYRTNPAAVDAHVRATIDRILELTPRLAARLDLLLKS